MNLNGILCFVTFVILNQDVLGSLPSYLSTCQRTDPKLNDCMLKIAKKSTNQFSKGDPSRKIPTLDPLEVKEIKTAAFGNSANTGIKILFTDVDIKGLKDIDLKKMTVDLDKGKFYTKAIANLQLDAEYDLSGRLLIFPLTGKGKARVNLNDVKLQYSFDADITLVDGVKYWKVRKDDLKYEVGKASFQLDNLFNGDKVLGPTTNTLLNDNWRDVLSELGPPVVKAIKDGFLKASQAFLAAVPFDELFPLDN